MDKILLIEDDIEIRTMLKTFLMTENKSKFLLRKCWLIYPISQWKA